MHPILFHFQNITIYSYSFFLALGLAVYLIFFVFHAHKNGYSHQTAWNLGFLVCCAVPIGAKVGFILVGYFSKSNFTLASAFSSGWYSAGGLLGGFLTAFLYIRWKKLEFWKWADMSAPAIALAESIVRIGCFMAGCCYGNPTSVPWAVVFNESPICPNHMPLHPTQIYQSLANLLIFVFLWRQANRSHLAGQIVLYYACLYGFSRMVIDFFRGDANPWLGGIISSNQLVAFSVILCIAICYHYKSKNDK